MERKLIFICLMLCGAILYAQEGSWLRVQPKSGDGLGTFLQRYNLNQMSCDLDSFLFLNDLNHKSNLILGKSYFLPVKEYTYNGISIRSTLNVSNWDMAVSIRDYNNALYEKGIRNKPYTDDMRLWVPLSLTDCRPVSRPEAQREEPRQKVILEPLFGSDWEKVKVEDEALRGHVYYIVSGHGGPDPGAIGEKDGNALCEDEYAYDVSLRLARNLMMHGAIVHMIIQDPNDGIRDDAFLKPDKDEICINGKALPLNQLERLKQRTEEVNKLFLRYKNSDSITHQRAIMIHVDSRQQGQKIDLFFYHHPSSNRGKALAENMLGTVKTKYEEHQKSRGYAGVVKERNLYVLREMHPVSVYIELGNITNAFDQKRLIVPNNRQALANWFTLGIIKHQGEP